MKKLPLFPFLFFIALALSPAKAEETNSPNLFPMASIDMFFKHVNAIDLTNLEHSSARIDDRMFPIKSLFLASLLNVLAEDGYDILIHLPPYVHEHFLKEVQGENGANFYDILSDKITTYCLLLNLPLFNPTLAKLLEEKSLQNKETYYLALKIGVCDRPLLNSATLDEESDFITWSKTTENNDQIDYYWLKKASNHMKLPPDQGELWVLLSANMIPSSLDTWKSVPPDPPSLQKFAPPSLSEGNLPHQHWSDWWNKRTPSEQNSLIKTAAFLGGCTVACFFPETALIEKACLVVCLPCVIELGETLSTSWFALLH